MVGFGLFIISAQLTIITVLLVLLMPEKESTASNSGGYQPKAGPQPPRPRGPIKP